MLKAKGTVEWVALHGALAGFEIGVQHIGPALYLRWLREVDAAKLAELPRILKARQGLEPVRELVPHLFPDSYEQIVMVSDEGRTAMDGIARKALEESVTEIRQNGLVLLSGRDAVEEIERWGLLHELFAVAIEQQALKVTDPLASGGRNSPVGGLSTDGGHSIGGD